MADFIDVVFQIEPPMLPMVILPLPPHRFHLAFSPDFASPQTHEERTHVVRPYAYGWGQDQLRREAQGRLPTLLPV